MIEWFRKLRERTYLWMCKRLGMVPDDNDQK
jgi:hypothetical protein